MEHILNPAELEELRKEYEEINERIRKLKIRKNEIDNTIAHNACNVVAGRFIPLEFGDRIRVTKSVYSDWFDRPDSVVEMEGFFGCFHLEDAHIYFPSNEINGVRLRLYQIRKNGTRSEKCDEILCRHIIKIEKA